MNRQHTRHRRASRAAARTLAVASAAALIAILGAGQALASTAPPDERVLERQGWIDRQTTDQGKAEESPQQAPPRPGPSSKPEPNVGPGPWIDDQPVAPAPVPTDGRTDLVILATVAVLVLALGVATAWWVRHRRPPPQPTS